MVEELDFCLLGPLRVRSGERDVPIGPGRQRALLATLLLSAGRMVPAAELIEALWGAAPPPAVRSSLQNHVMRLRRALGEPVVITQPGGYLIDIEPARLDVRRFETTLARAKAAAQTASWAAAAGLLRAGLELWRGQPLSGVDSEALERREVPRLTELRLQALETQLLADLYLGRHTEMISLARQLAVTYPLRERLHALLMIALYLDGQQAGALTAYQNVRDGLVIELGIEPGAELRRVHQQILKATPPAEVLANVGGAGAGLTAVPVPAPRAAPVPRQLPPLAGNFTGRDAELASLTSLASPTSLAGDVGGQRGTSPVTVISGTAGVGKTALAVYWARQVANRFPDGQLYLDLRGYGPDGPGGRLSPAVALAGLLRSQGLPDRDIPADTEERAARYRSMLTGRRLLIVLDNAAAADQVRPLLPAAGGCLTVVTSRDMLAGLMARDGARRMELGPLPLPDAIALLSALTAGRVAAASPARIADLAERCARLPLALRVAAELVAARPGTSMASLTAELADQGLRLDLLDAGGDPRTALRAVFSWSCQQLDAETARDFRLLGLHPGPDFDEHAAAALTEHPVRLAAGSLTRLVRASLVQVDWGTRRYSMHDLLRAYAAEQVTAADGWTGRQAALSRLLDHYAGVAAAAMDVLYPAERHQRPRVRPGETVADGGPAAGALAAGADAARSWLGAERRNLVGAVGFAAAGGWPVRAVQLAGTISRYLDAGGHYLAAVEVHGHAVSAARQAGDLAAEATALMNLGMAEVRLGRSARAASHLRRAVALSREAGDAPGEARATGDLGCLYLQLGHYDLARSCFWQALALFRQSGDRIGEARALVNLGDICRQRGRHEQAVRYLGGSATLAAAIGDEAARAYALAYLGDVRRRQGRYQAAARHLRQALRLCRRTGSRRPKGTRWPASATCTRAPVTWREPGGCGSGRGRYTRPSAARRRVRPWR